MPRRRLAVALLIPQPLATEIDGIRRACGDPRLGRIGPHITLVPPVNVAADDVAAVGAICRRAAAAAPVMRIALGAPSTFAPATPLAWLSVAGDLEPLARLRDSLHDGPLARPDDHAFVPHVTISDKVADVRLRAIVDGLADFQATAVIDRAHLLENQQLPNGRWGWLPLADAPFGPSALVGRGGLELELTTGSVLDPASAASLGGSAAPSGPMLVVVARRDGTHVGVAAGTAIGELARLDGLVVADGHRRQGVGSHLLARFSTDAAARGCTELAHTARSDDPVTELCRLRGWTEMGDRATTELTTVVRMVYGE